MKIFDQYILQYAGTVSNCLTREQRMLCSLAGKGFAVIRCIEEGYNLYVELFFSVIFVPGLEEES